MKHNTPKTNKTESHGGRVTDSIIIKDTVRRDSKVASSLDFTYIDEQCENVLKPLVDEFPVEKVKMEPITPIISGQKFPSWHKSECKVSDFFGSQSKEGKRFSDEDTFNSEMFDDSELKTKTRCRFTLWFCVFPEQILEAMATKTACMYSNK